MDADVTGEKWVTEREGGWKDRSDRLTSREELGREEGKRGN